MDFEFSDKDKEFNQELLQFINAEYNLVWDDLNSATLDENWQLTLDMRQKLANNGWLTMHWPGEYGGQDASAVRSAIFNEAMSYHRVPGRDNFGVRMMGATLMLSLIHI